MSPHRVESEHPVAPLELFFDLVFAFAFTQVTTLLSGDATFTGLAHAVLVLAALWWAWASFAWLTNAIDSEDDLVIAALLAAMAALFIGALAVPEAFGSEGIVFGVAFLIVNCVQAALYALGARDDGELTAAITRTVPFVLGGAALILVAGVIGGGLRVPLWIAALAVGFVGPALVGVRGWRVLPAHFVERHGLIVIIAIGESLVAIGVGARGTHLHAGVIVGAVLGLVVATSFWLAYFDFFTIRARQLLDTRTGDDQVAFARDIYTYIHLPMIVGIVLFAFGVKKTLPHLHAHPATLVAVALCGGPALYLSAYVALRLRVTRSLGRGRPIAAAACWALIPVVTHVSALAGLTLVAAVSVGLHAYELIRWRDARTEARVRRTPAAG